MHTAFERQWEAPVGHLHRRNLLMIGAVLVGAYLLLQKGGGAPGGTTGLPSLPGTAGTPYRAGGPWTVPVDALTGLGQVRAIDVGPVRRPGPFDMFAGNNPADFPLGSQIIQYNLLSPGQVVAL